MGEKICTKGSKKLTWENEQTIVRIENFSLKAKINLQASSSIVNWQICARPSNKSEEEIFRKSVSLEVTQKEGATLIIGINTLPVGPLRGSVIHEVELSSKIGKMISFAGTNGSIIIEGYNGFQTTLENSSFFYEGSLEFDSKLEAGNGNITLKATVIKGIHTIRQNTGVCNIGLNRASSVRYRVVVDTGTINEDVGQFNKIEPSWTTNISEGEIGSGVALLDIYLKSGAVNLYFI
jgi:hypothetical protein